MSSLSSSRELAKWKSDNSSLSRLVAQAEKTIEQSRFTETSLETAAIFEDSNSLSLDRIQSVKKISRKLSNIKAGVRTLNRVVGRLTSGAEGQCDEEDLAVVLQKKLETLQSTLADFRSSMRSEFESTLVEERTLDREIVALNERFAAWDSFDSHDDVNFKPTARKPALKLSKLASNHETESRDSFKRKLQAIEDKIVREGGLTGGWHQQEQQYFLSIWNPLLGANPKLPEHDSAAFRGLSARVRERAVQYFV